MKNAIALGALGTMALLGAAPAEARTGYITGGGKLDVLDTATNTIGTPIPIGSDPQSVAITPDGLRAWVPRHNDPDLSLVDTTTNTVIGAPIPTGFMLSVAITPDGSRAYLSSPPGDSVSVMDTATSNVIGAPIPVGDTPRYVAIAPDGSRAYVSNTDGGTVSVIDIATNTVTGTIPVGIGPRAIAFTPDGSRAYVGNALSNEISVINTATNAVIDVIPNGVGPGSVAITPDGSRAYVGHAFSNDVSVIDIATNTVIGAPIPVGDRPIWVAITPDGSRAYTANLLSDDVSAIDTTTNTVIGGPIPIGGNPSSIAFIPAQAPTAAFSASPGSPVSGQSVGFDGRASTDPDGTVARYDWDFGDGAQAADGGATPSHTYSSPGTYTVRLTVTDNEGCSTELVFTGQTALCNGSPSASTTRTVTVDPVPDLKILSLERHRKDGTATLTVEANVAGNLNIGRTNKVKGFGPVTLAEAGQAELEVVARDHLTRTLERKGRLTVNPRIQLYAEDGYAGIRHKFKLRQD